MITGILKSKDVFQHPLLLISIYGLRRFLRLFFMALSPKTHKFIEEVTIVGARAARHRA